MIIVEGCAIPYNRIRFVWDGVLLVSSRTSSVEVVQFVMGRVGILECFQIDWRIFIPESAHPLDNLQIVITGEVSLIVDIFAT